MNKRISVARSFIENEPENASFDIFGEMANTLLYWVRELHAHLLEKNIKQVFFLSREGQPLKKMFDLYCEKVGVPIGSRYLEVSRRSTLLPSLENIEHEKFETLFRQYRRMSLKEFLFSLGLDEFCSYFLEQLGVTDEEFEQRVEDFPSSEIFQKLKSLPQFVEIYDEQRLSRKSAFLNYLAELSQHDIPQNLVVVDVGWKGTIQDNLYALLCTGGESPVQSVTGYYIGLIAPGAVGPRNIKHGLLFSSVLDRSSYFHVFNENRALFEILLAADHGSASSYYKDATGQPQVVHDVFLEKDMLEALVFPVQRSIFKHYDFLLDKLMLQGSQQGRRLSLKQTAYSHARLVFQPTCDEINWFSLVFHVENYGVFERSFFNDVRSVPNVYDRLKFMFSVLRRSKRGLLGFWPWKTLNERVGYPVAKIYGLVRYFQK